MNYADSKWQFGGQILFISRELLNGGPELCISTKNFLYMLR